MLSCPDDILLKIILHTLEWIPISDEVTLMSLWLICQRIYRLIQKNKDYIVDKSIRVNEHDGVIVYHFCNLTHRGGGLPAEIKDGEYSWWRFGRLHRDNDLPAVINTKLQMRAWYQYGHLHRDNDLPAYIDNYISKWYQHGQLHRDNDKPAFIQKNHMSRWYQHGQLHRDNDKPASIGCNGEKSWYYRGKRHRLGDKPALIMPDIVEKWYYYNELHRLTGPAVRYSTGEIEWYKYGKKHNGANPHNVYRIK